MNRSKIFLLLIATTSNIASGKSNYCGFGFLEERKLDILDLEVASLIKGGCKYSDFQKLKKRAREFQGQNRVVLLAAELSANATKERIEDILAELTAYVNEGNGLAALLLGNINFPLAKTDPTQWDSLEILFLFAESQGYVYASNQLGGLYNMSIQNKRNLEKAEKYLKEAIKNEVPGSSYNLGILKSEQGQKELAKSFFLKDAKKGHAKSAFNYAVLSKGLSSDDDSPEDFEKFMKLSANLGYDRAMFELGKWLVNKSDDNEHTRNEGLDWLKKAFDLGHNNAGLSYVWFRVSNSDNDDFNYDEFEENIDILEAVGSKGNIKA